MKSTIGGEKCERLSPKQKKGLLFGSGGDCFFLGLLLQKFSMGGGSKYQSEKDVKAPNLFERAKEEMEAILHREKEHHKETHGMSNDIDADTPIDKVKAPSVFHRAKEEIEAFVETIHHKEHDHK